MRPRPRRRPHARHHVRSQLCLTCDAPIIRKIVLASSRLWAHNFFLSSALNAKDVHESQCFLWAGDSCCGGTPGPIPNPVVKPTRADGTAGATLWESRASPSHKPYWLFFVCRQGRDAPLLAPKALHLTYISAKQIFRQLLFCEITYISAVEMYVIWFSLVISHGQQRKKGGTPVMGTPSFVSSVLLSGDSPLPGVCQRAFTRRWCRRQACRRSEPSRY